MNSQASLKGEIPYKKIRCYSWVHLPFTLRLEIRESYMRSFDNLKINIFNNLISILYAILLANNLSKYVGKIS
jgi:hypothetical protein